MSHKNSGNSTPPWEVLVLVANYLDPTTLAKASCVSKSWSISMSSDHIWTPLCTLHFPSLSKLKLINTQIPYRRLYTMGRTAAKLRHKTPNKPLLSLHNLIFIINVCFKSTGRPIINVATPGTRLNHEGLFRFDINVDCSPEIGELGAVEELVMSWNVVLEGWSTVFTMVECVGKVGLGCGGEGWFSAELPAPGCWWSESRSGVVGDVKLSFSEGEGGVRVSKVSVGMLSIVSWRYASIENGLNYLQRFLLPTNCS